MVTAMKDVGDKEAVRTRTEKHRGESGGGMEWHISVMYREMCE